jgi:pimeloyl-ACP methyl ester carboxylesterase
MSISSRMVSVCPLALLLTSAFAQPSPIMWEKFKFNAPQVGVVDAERGWVQVPERHAEPAGKKIRLYVVKLPATTSKPGPPIVWLAGGPGNSGSRTPASAWYPAFEALRKYGDVIAFDQRGTGSSEPSLTVPMRFDPLETSPSIPRRRSVAWERLATRYRQRFETVESNSPRTIRAKAQAM